MPFDVKVQWPQNRLNALWQMGPSTTAFHVRDALGAIMGRFRRNFLKQHQGTPMHTLARASVHYLVFPKDVKRRGSLAAVRGRELAAGRAVRGGLRLSDVHLRMWSTSEVTEAHETGRTITSPEGMVIPIGAWREAIHAFRKANPEVGRYARKGVDRSSIGGFWVPGKMFKRGGVYFRKNPDGTATPVAVERRSVRLQARLGFFATWRKQQQDVQRSLQKAADRIVQDLAAGINRTENLALDRDSLFGSREGIGSGFYRRGGA